MPRRLRSVPPPAPPSSESPPKEHDGVKGKARGAKKGQQPTVNLTAMPSPSSPPPATRPKPPSASSKPPSAPPLLAQADALARMTIELNLRAVATQAERLERDLKALVVCTARDKDFRERHEQRLEDMWREILAVKKRMGEFQERSREDVERCQRETADSMGQLRREMGQLRGLVGDVSASLDKLPLGIDAESKFGALSTQGSHPHDTIKHRIKETLSSTRRWNRDHKTTPLSDAPFIANYLKQQSKRDPPMAVFIQRALQKHISRRHGGSGSSSSSNNNNGNGHGKARPRNLEQFCQGLKWRDVIETLEDALVRDGRGVVKALM